LEKRILGLTFASHCANHMFFESLGPLLPFLILAFDLSHAEAGRLGFAYFLVYGLSNYPAGFLCDRYGRRVFILLFLLISSGATALMAFSSSYVHLLLLCGAAGFGGGLYHAPATALITDHFAERRRGAALGAHASGGALGILLTFVIVGSIASHWTWQAALISLAALGLTLAGCFRTMLWDVGKRVSPAESDSGVKVTGNVGLWTLTKGLSYMLLLYGVVMFLWKGAYTWIPTYLKETYGFTAGRAIVFSLVLPIIGIFSNYLMGRFSDRYGRKKSLILVFSSLALGFSLLFVGEKALLIPLMVLLGFFLNSFSGIVNAYLGDLFPSEVLGKAFGITFTFSICISAFSPYVMGVISDHSSLSTSMLFLGIICFIGILVSLHNPRRFKLQI
jgi:MFS family permease